MESKDAGKINCVNVKHVLGQRGELMAGIEVVMTLNTQRYHCTAPLSIINLLDWAPVKKKVLLPIQGKRKDKIKKTGEKVYT